MAGRNIGGGGAPDTDLPAPLRQHVPTLHRLGVADLRERYRAYRRAGHPRDADRFLIWLRRQGDLTLGDLVEVHTSSPVDVSPTGGPDRVGAQIEQRYTILTELGRGGMGAVHLARDSHLGRAVALKVLLDGSSQWIAQRFVDEARITAQLDHPNIVSVYALEHTRDGAPALAMKVVRGRTLEDLVYGARAALKAGRPLDADEQLSGRLQHFAKVCDALSYAHDRGVIHRDLKPENLMVGSHGEVFVMDWGIARVIATEDEEEAPDAPLSFGTGTIDKPVLNATMAGTVIGTPAYMSPEQAAGEDLTPASDQYALGLILYELVCMQRANQAATVEETLLRALAATRPPRRHALGERVDPDLSAIIHKATAPEPEDRYADVRALAADVQRYVRGEETQARPDNAWRRSRRWLSAHIGVLVTLLALSGIAAVSAVGIGVIAVALLQARAAQHETQVTRTVGRVAAKAHSIDAQLLRHRATVDQVATAVEQLWTHGPPQAGPIFHRDDFEVGRQPFDYVHQPFYGRPVSLREVLTLVPPGVDFEPIEADIRKLQPMRSVLREAALTSTDAELLDAPAEEQDRVLGTEGASATWAYVGLENGVLLNYPGLPDLGADYDPRERPWYVASRGQRSSAWGELYQDASGFDLLLPCNRGVFDVSGEPLGVVGMDMSLGAVADLLDMDGAETAWVVDDRGVVVVSTAQRGMNLGATLNDNRALARDPLPVASVRQAIVEGSPSGLETVDGRTVVWNRLTAVDWTYVVVLEDGGW